MYSIPMFNLNIYFNGVNCFVSFQEEKNNTFHPHDSVQIPHMKV